MSRSQRQGWRPLSGWWLSVFLLLSALSLMLPPMQSPDENAHLLRAGMLAEGQWRLQPAPADTPRDLAGLGGWVDKNLIDFSSTYLAVATRTQGMPPSEIKTQVASLHWALETAFYPVPGTGYYFPLIYAPQAIALWVGRAANLTMAHSYQLVRTTTLLLVCTLLALAWGRLPPNPAVVAILTLPMGLFQALSPTLDGMTTALAVLAISQFLTHLAIHPGDRTFPWGLYICLFFLVTSRTHLLPLLLLPMFLAWQDRTKLAWLGWISLSLSSLLWVLYAMASTTDVRIVRDQTTSDLLRLYAYQPQDFLLLIWNTFQHHDLLHFYWQSFIGILGWLDTPLRNADYSILGACLAIAAIASISWHRWRIDFRCRALLLLVAFTSAAMVFLALALTWTPYPAQAIEGVQGRYFTIPALLLGYALSGQDTEQLMASRPWTVWVTILVALASLAALVLTLRDRYHFLI